MATAAPNDPDLQFLAARCVTRGGTEQSLRDIQSRWPSHPWTASALGRLAAASAHWEEAEKQYEIAARGSIALATENAEALLRVRRVLHGPDARVPEEAHRFIKSVARWESGAEVLSPEPNALAMQALHRGDLERARSLAMPPGRLTALVGASDGASREMVKAALDLDLRQPQWMTNPSALFVRCLARREGVGVAGYEGPWHANFGPGAEHLMQLVDRLSRGDVGSEATRDLNGADPQIRGFLLACAAVARGPSTPPQWRQDAKRLLFWSERPYLK